ncbi:MAG: HEPN domain-containing protein [Actinobacteria bacterium]|nr:HEPN domain-containing protein [Actinomycetota bacterium]MCL5771414.1 HEPN domain-containing protein [Actinomycetota bacterium]
MNENTKKEWLNWIKRAINDYKSAKKLITGKNKYLDTSVFHSQQAAEKILKSFLVYKNIRFERIHSIVYLIDKCSEIDKSFNRFYSAAEILTPYATVFRYPGDYSEPEIIDAKEALKYVKKIINFVLDIYISNKLYMGEKIK